ncbi:MAG TPA: nuclear transport factor 2 family protein [Acidimicrobiia bacterium]|nr:nuclear transport factor 2 family protein [Acidimicrobiia bacterium]
MTVTEWIDAYRQAWEDRDPEAAASLFTEDAWYRSNIYEDPHEGREGVTAYWAGVTSAQIDVSVQMGQPLVEGDRVAVEFWTNMAVEGDPVTLAGCLLLEFASDGRCRRLREYWNFEQGTHSPPPGWGT